MNKKDLRKKVPKTILEEQKRQILVQAKKTLTEEASFDTDDLPDEIDLASADVPVDRLPAPRREKFLLAKIDKALARIATGTFGVCERCEDDRRRTSPAVHDALHPLQGGAGAEGEELRVVTPSPFSSGSGSGAGSFTGWSALELQELRPDEELESPGAIAVGR